MTSKHDRFVQAFERMFDEPNGLQLLAFTGSKPSAKAIFDELERRSDLTCEEETFLRLTYELRRLRETESKYA